ncbi:MAG: glycosyltransferase family 1 protein, partial [Chlorobiota bacterium]
TSDYGGKVENFNGQTVERGLKLFANNTDIYQPFICTPEHRVTMSAHNIVTLKRIVEQFEPDVIFVWNLYFFDEPFLDAIKQMKQPIVYLLTDNWLIAFLNAPFIQGYFAENVLSKRPLTELLYLRAKRWLSGWRKPQFLLPGHAIFPSRFMRTLYAEANFGFDNKTVIYHGVNLPEKPKNDFTDRKKLVKNGEVNLLIAGRIVELKGVHTVIESLPAIKRALPGLKVHLTVLGDDRDRTYVERIQDRIAALGVVDIVKFAQPVAEDELFTLFQNHDIFLFPSLYEPFSLTLIYALGAGIPTIASNAGGNPEIVDHLHTGLLFPPGHERKLAEAVVRLTTDYKLRELLSEKARSIARQYTFIRMLKEIEHVLGTIQ